MRRHLLALSLAIVPLACQSGDAERARTTSAPLGDPDGPACADIGGAACEVGGNGACHGLGSATSDCDACCAARVPAALLGVDIDPKNAAAFPTVADITSLGATRVRIELKVDHTAGANDDAAREAELARAFTFYDGAIRRYTDAGVQVLLTLDYATLDGSRDLAAAGFASFSEYADRFAASAAEIARRYPVDGYEIWNEEDLCEGAGYCPRLEVDAYAELLGKAAAAVHGANGAAQVVSGGLASGEWESYANDLVTQMGDAFATSVDGVGLHPYTAWPNGLGDNSLEYEIDQLSALTGKPLWLTEWGDGGREADSVRAYTSFFADPTSGARVAAIAQAYLFAWSQAQKPAEQFGVVDASGKHTPAWDAFASAASLGRTTVLASTNLTTATVTPGRTCADAPQFAVAALGDADATLASAPAAGCLGPSDEVLLIDLQGTSASNDGVGNWELLVVDQVDDARVAFTTPKTRIYDGADDGIGDQKVALIRVPSFGDLTVGAGAVVTANRWNGATGGVVALRAGSMRVAGSISAAGLGYRGGRWSQDDADCNDDLPTEAGESISGRGGATTARNVGGSGGLSAVSGVSYNSNTPICASAGHAEPGQPGVNPVGRVIGEPGGTYGTPDGTRLTMGSGPGGNLTCAGFWGSPRYVDEPWVLAGGIVLLLVDELTVAPSGSISATPPDQYRDVAGSGGYVLIRGGDLALGENRVTANGAHAISGSPPTAGKANRAGAGYVVLAPSGSLSGTTSPAANVIAP
jgi:hypothetical protein